MLSQENSIDPNTDWKKQYTQILKELDVKEKEWERQQQDLLKSILHLTFSYQGSNDILDKKLSDLKKALTQNTALPFNEIENIVQTILNLKKDRDADFSRTNQLINNIIQLLSNNNQFSQIENDINEIKDSVINKNVDAITYLKSLNRIIGELNQSSLREKKKPDDFKVFLKKLSKHKNTDPSLAELCNKSIALKSEQEKLKAINLCIEKIHQLSTINPVDNDSNNDNNPDCEIHIEKLVTLLDWITIPGKSQNKLDTLKKQLQQRQDASEIGHLIRRIALTISNAYMQIQTELKETESFLKKVTQQLNEITLQIADIENLENKSFSDSLSHNSEMEKQIKLIQTGVNDAESIEAIKETISTRIEVLQDNMDQFIHVEQQRKKRSNKQHNQLLEKLNAMESETDKLRQCIEEERSKAYSDALTGIPNRMAFDERAQHEFQRWQRYNNKLTLCLIDIDKFKHVNDTYGHKAGDIVLRTVAEKCMTKVRKSDFFCRYGGEEFALILPETELSAAITVAETLRTSIERCPFHYGDKHVPITISCGLAKFSDKDSTDSVFKRADKALYQAKERGRNRSISEEQLHLM